MALINKQPYITPEMIAAWNSGGGGNPFSNPVVLFEKRFKTSDLDSNKQYYHELTSAEESAVNACSCILFELSYYGTNTSGALQTVGVVMIDRVSHHTTNIRTGNIYFKAGVDDDTKAGAMAQLRLGDNTSDRNVVKVLFQATTAYINDQWSPNHLWEMRAIKLA